MSHKGVAVKESAIVRQILEYLAAERIFAFRLNTSATKIGDRFFRAHNLGPGTADILAFEVVRLPERGLFIPVWIECKTEKGKQSQYQEFFMRAMRELGHKYVLARSVDDVAELWEASKRNG